MKINGYRPKPRTWPWQTETKPASPPVKRLQIIAFSASILAIAGLGANQWYTFQKKWNIDHYDWKKDYFIGSDGFLHHR
jgi:hypothetical protein